MGCFFWVFFCGLGTFPVWIAEQGQCHVKWWWVNRHDSQFAFYISVIFILSSVGFSYVFVHTREFHGQCSYVVNISVHIHVWSKKAEPQRTQCLCAASVCVCFCIHKRDRWQGKVSWGNEKWSIKCSSHPFPMLYALMLHLKKRQVVPTKNPTFTFMETLQEDAFLWLSKTITCLQSFCDILFYFLLCFSAARQPCTCLIPHSPAHLSHIFLSPCSPLKPGDPLLSTSLSPWSFKQIAKEKFNVPLRDNYQTVKPHSSRWVITFPQSLLFSPTPQMKPSVFKTSTIDSSPVF